jgi:hypothetical protein
MNPFSSFANRRLDHFFIVIIGIAGLDFILVLGL